MMVAVVPLALLYKDARGLNTTAAKNLFTGSTPYICGFSWQSPA